jgi:glycosyl-4,4'-diaponeurosporenoate acyltransferase
MQVLFLPKAWTILSFFLVWPLLQFFAIWICQLISLDMLDHATGFFKPRRWENRRFYQRFLKISRWKRYLPDGAAITRMGFEKKHLVSTNAAYLSRFLAESCRAELGHWLAILPFWVFGLWAPPVVMPLMLLYALVANLPCIIAQRYNRPRIAQLLKQVSAVSENASYS